MEGLGAVRVGIPAASAGMTGKGVAGMAVVEARHTGMLCERRWWAARGLVLRRGLGLGPRSSLGRRILGMGVGGWRGCWGSAMGVTA